MISAWKVEGSWVKTFASLRWNVDSSMVGRSKDVVDWANACPTRCLMAWGNDLALLQKNCWLFLDKDDVARHCCTMRVLSSSIESFDESIVLKSTVALFIFWIGALIELCSSLKCPLA